MAPNMSKFKFIDLFAGIGGIRIGFEEAGGTCVFSSEYDRYSQKTYEALHGDRPDFSGIRLTDPAGDITLLPPEEVPDHDILTGGFPCQPFSLAGVSKKQSMGRPHGFDDPTQGTLFFNVKSIIEAKQPKAFLLENVKNLCSHDKGKTFQVIQQTLDALGYRMHYKVLDARAWVPQHRERIFIVGFRRPDKKQGWDVNDFSFDDVKLPEQPVDLESILEKRVPEKYTLGPGTWDTLERHKARHEAKGQGFGYGLIERPFKGKTTRTISARYHKDGAEVLIHQPGKRPRRLTPLECSRLMGFPKWVQKFYSRNGATKDQPVSDTQAYRQFGNSVAVPVIISIAAAMTDALERNNALPE
ncbi:MAG: DNA (cytosine-5-)-methyltransferase [Pseudodesulfovibrio sp.]|nr:DNA (cytosine-5-)-methyltransferase [Pseudodesulfovibrio sp.]